MIGNLESNQLLAVAMTSYLFYHPEPMSLIASETPCENGTVSLPFWVSEEKGTIVCSQSYRPVYKNQGRMIRLPDTSIPLRKIAEGCDLTMPDGRNQFIWQIMRHVVLSWWSMDIDLAEIGLGSELVDNMRKRLMEPTYTPSGTQDAAMVLNNIIVPVLEEGKIENGMVH